MLIPTPVFMLEHVGIVLLLSMAYPEKYRLPLYAFGAVQDIVEHYADVFPNVAAAGPFLIIIGLSLLGLHYYYANQLIADKRIVWGGLASYLVVLFVAKGFELG